MIKAIIFDCFGVLITDAFAELVEQCQIRKPEVAVEFKDLIQLTSRGLLSRQEFTERAAVVMDMSPDELLSRTRNGEVKNAALFAYARELRKAYKTAILSNVSRDGFWQRFTHAELAPYFDAIVLSGEEGVAKPEPAAYERTADKLALRFDECLMVDDRDEYCEGARAVGMKAITYQSIDQLRSELARLGISA